MKPTKSHHMFRAEIVKLYLEGSFSGSEVTISVFNPEYISIHVVNRFYSFTIDLRYDDQKILDCDIDDLLVRIAYPGNDYVSVGYLKTVLTVMDIVLSKVESMLVWCKLDRYEWFSSHVKNDRIRVTANNMSQTFIIYVCPSIGWASYDEMVQEYLIREIPFSDFMDEPEKTFTEFVSLMEDLIRLNKQIALSYTRGIESIIHDATQIVIKKINELTKTEEVSLEV